MIYAGIGSRTTPPDVIAKMVQIGKAMATMNCTLRSGGAEGADEAFEAGCDLNQGKKEIYLPWQGFRRNSSPLFGTTREARLLAKQFHPKWEILGARARDFMGRNSYQVLGQTLDTPADVIICWTPGGKIVGGTGQALRMAEHYEIPVVNLGSKSDDEVSDSIFAIHERKTNGG